VILYLDTSALVKIYVEEKGSTGVREKADEAEGIATSRIAYAEARAALARKLRESGLSRSGYRTIIGHLDRDWEAYFTVDVSDAVVKFAGVLAERHALRGADAIRLASAVTLGQQGGESIVFFCFGERLAMAARKEALRIVNSQ
jgi:uncharacterized protein